MKPIVNRLSVSLIGTSIISILLGVFYVFDVISFEFLGPEAGSQREVVNFWGMISLGVGTILIISCLSMEFGKRRIINALLVFLLILHFMFQIPPLLMWGIVGAMGFIKDFIFGISLHVLLSIMIIRTMIIANR